MTEKASDLDHKFARVLDQVPEVLELIVRKAALRPPNVTPETTAIMLADQNGERRAWAHLLAMKTRSDEARAESNLRARDSR